MEDAGTSLSKITLRGDSLYILSSKGMLVKNLQTGTTDYLYPSIQETHGEGSSFLIDSKKNIWIAQHKQIVRINMQNPKEKYIYKYGEKGLGKFQVLEMAEYPDGTLYLGTYGTGLYKFNSKENCFEQCTVSNIHYCYNLSVTPHGYLAISKEKDLLI